MPVVSEQDLEQLEAYVDGELSTGEEDALARRLAGRADPRRGHAPRPRRPRHPHGRVEKLRAERSGRRAAGRERRRGGRSQHATGRTRCGTSARLRGGGVHRARRPDRPRRQRSDDAHDAERPGRASAGRTAACTGGARRWSATRSSSRSSTSRASRSACSASRRMREAQEFLEELNRFHRMQEQIRNGGGQILVPSERF